MAYRIQIFGGSGNGKTAMAVRLGKLLDIKPIHIDDIFWQRHWKMLGYSKLKEIIENKIKEKENWILDGNYTRIGSDIIEYSTHIIIMRIPLIISLWRLFWREIVRRTEYKFLNVTRPPINVVNDENPESLWKGYIELMGHSIKYYKYRVRERVRLIRKLRPNLPVFIYSGSSDDSKLIDFLKN